MNEAKTKNEDDEMMKNKNDSGDDANIAHLSIKPPQFTSNYSSGWFEIVEAQFALANIKSSTTKFFHALSAMPPDLVYKLSPSVLTNKDYGELKTAVTTLFESSKAEIFERLTQHTPLVGKPSLFLRELLTQAKKVGVGEDLIRHRFLNSMPQTVRPVLVAQQSLSLEQLGTLADDLIPLMGGVHAIQDAHANDQASRSVSDRAKQRNIDYRDIPTGLKPFHAEQKPKVCRAHLYFAEKARNCKPWCKFPITGAKPKMLPSSRPSSRTSSPSRSSSPTPSGSENGKRSGQ